MFLLSMMMHSITNLDSNRSEASPSPPIHICTVYEIKKLGYASFNVFDYTGVSADFLKDERGRLNGYDQGRLEKSQNERLSSSDSIKTIAFSVYSQSRVVLPEIVRGLLPKSMTRFGPASAMVDLLNDLERKEPIYYK
ncbi:unnamed protein product, partial [Gongylonema pulchrum]|uniref:Piwi domain-containing protein n=1 Tax=Gongylonema pulchrum TaxID=637853 RepID=A0A183F1L2_9BILA